MTTAATAMIPKEDTALPRHRREQAIARAERKIAAMHPDDRRELFETARRQLRAAGVELPPDGPLPGKFFCADELSHKLQDQLDEAIDEQHLRDGVERDPDGTLLLFIPDEQG